MLAGVLERREAGRVHCVDDVIRLKKEKRKKKNQMTLKFISITETWSYTFCF